MPYCFVKYAGLNIKWKFAGMPPQIPSPGNAAFAKLVKELAPYGLTPRSVTIETPSHNLGDAALEMSLLNDVAKVRVTYEGVEVSAYDLQSGETMEILNVLKAVFSSLETIDVDLAKEGDGGVKISFHLGLQGADVDDYWSENISAILFGQKIPLDMAAWKLNMEEFSGALLGQAAVAKSIVYKNALYVELNYVVAQKNAIEPGAVFESVANHYQKIFSMLRLELTESE
jgi:hypothetical protein